MHPPSAADAQPAAGPFAVLAARLAPGDTVYVTTVAGPVVKGAIVRVTDTALGITVRGQLREFFSSQVARVERRRRDAVWNGVGIGAGAGAALGGLAGSQADGGSCRTECGQGTLLGAVGGAFWGGVIGGVVDAFKQRREVLFEAPEPGRLDQRPRNVSAAPGAVKSNARSPALPVTR